MSTSEEPMSDVCMDMNEDSGSSKRRKGKFKDLKEVDPDDHVSLAKLARRGKKHPKGRTSQETEINLESPLIIVKATPKPKTPLKIDTATAHTGLRIQTKKAATSVDPQFAQPTQQTIKHKESAMKRKAEQGPISTSKGKAKRKLEYERTQKKQKEQPRQEKERQLPINKEIIGHSNFDSMYSTAKEYNVDLRILKLWYGQLHGAESMQSIVFIARYEKGNCRQGFVPIGLVEHWKSILNEGSAYAISRASIIDSNSYVKLIDHKHQLTFTERTTLNPLSDTDIPLEPLYKLQKLNTLQQIEKGKEIEPPKQPSSIKIEVLKDVLTLVINIRPPTTKHTKKKLIQFVEVFMTDKTIFPRVSVLTIWKEEYEKTKIFSLPFKKQFVLLASGLKTNNFRDRYGLQTSMFTRFEIDPEDMHEAPSLLREVTDKAAQLQVGSIEMPRFSELYCKTPETIYTINQLRALTCCPPVPSNDLYYMIQATIMCIYTDFSMTYRACAICLKGMKYEVNDQYGCSDPQCVNRQGKTTLRYKITMDVKDDTDTLNLTVFNQDAEQILQIPAPELEQHKLEDNGLMKIHNLVSKAHGKAFKFLFRYDFGNHKSSLKGKYTVTSVDWSPRVFTPVHNVDDALVEDIQDIESESRSEDQETPEDETN